MDGSCATFWFYWKKPNFQGKMVEKGTKKKDESHLEKQ